MNSTTEIMERGISCLLEKLGTIETERFISTIMRERFDYTKWRKDHFVDMTVDELNSAAADYDSVHPFHPRKSQADPE